MTEQPPTVACVECAYSDNGILFYWCKSPARYLDVVTGEKQRMLCDDARRFDALCGFTGKWFKRKESE